MANKDFMTVIYEWLTNPFSNMISETVRGYLLLIVQYLCELQDAMPSNR